MQKKLFDVGDVPVIDGWSTTKGTTWDRAETVYEQLKGVEAEMVLVPTQDLKAMAEKCLPNRNQSFPEREVQAVSYRGPGP